MHISSMEEEGETAMKTHHFVLVHGLGGGGWCWYKLRCLMENSGHRVSCIDLTSGGIDLTDADSVHSFDVYNKPLMDFMSVLPDQEQVILVGHSAGGLSVTEATHKFAKKIRVAVYVAATMLKLGFQTDEDLKDGVPDLSEFGDVYDLGFGLGADHPPTSALVKKHYQRNIIYHMSPQEDSTLAGMLLRPGPMLALTSARFTEGQEDKLVPRVYIKTAHDRVIKPHQQDNMINKWPPSQVMGAPLTGTDLRDYVMSEDGITLKNFKPALPMAANKEFEDLDQMKEVEDAEPKLQEAERKHFEEIEKPERGGHQ